ncbi:hypothetical protein ONS95_001407 [Cadophora gregata]|uniref:uncharacterized protein n=1 Tax=Cadophora gregata TaxID=51156 RepID=UPI0026DCA943|nr:uncharacterized protein ONS95_001407 [Cadophora gregata]KAK0111027.1 hypothetical protein ONS95_001407 [Cadophora gregata]KAK0112513.1 hypothetical protein ONS96_001749 [Cadophora gregata f. sp. sojae]
MPPKSKTKTKPIPSTTQSTPQTLLLLSQIFATILLSFGLNAIFRPLSGLSFFELYPSSSPLTPASTHETTLITALMTVYGIRDVFMAVAIYLAAYYADGTGGNGNGTGGSSGNVAGSGSGNPAGRKVLGGLLIAASAVAFVDGAVCRWIVGMGEWGHWGYAPVLGVLGGLIF